MLDQSVQNEQIRLIYRQGPVLVLGATFIGLLVFGFLWPFVPGYPLLTWMLLILLSATLRGAVFIYYQWQSDERKGDAVWGKLFYLGSFAAGCVWGALPLLFYAEIAPEYLLLLSTIFAGMVSVTAAAGSIYLPSFYTFAVPLLVPVAVMHLFSELNYLAVTGVMMILFLLVNSLLAHRGHRQYVDLIEARFANSDLMQQLSAEKQTAEQAVIIKNQFLAAASHDLRQPLHALGMLVGSLRRRDTNPQRLEIIKDMETSTKALSQLLHGMLDLSKLEADMIHAKNQAVELCPLLSSLREEFEPQVRIKKLALDIPETDVVIFTDALLLERVLRNLISNAVRYTQRGAVTVTVQDLPGDHCELRVSDTGSGIAEHEHDKVFADYYQIRRNDGRETVGMGLGLSIVKRFCHLMEIPLQMHSLAGVGTEFVLQIRSIPDHVVQPGVASSEVEVPENYFVLLIDDEHTVLKSMQGMLNDWGCIVVTASSGKEALYCLAQTTTEPDIILCDYRLANGELGVDTIAALREGLARQVPAVLISGDTSPAILRDVTGRGLQLLHKPVAEDKLRQTLVELAPVSGQALTK